MSWSVGYTKDGAEPVVLDDNVQFGEGMHLLVEGARKAIYEAEQSESNDMYQLEMMLAVILDINNDPGIMDDLDQWEDMDFFGPEVTYWIVEN
jgi:hypothetical protein